MHGFLLLRITCRDGPFVRFAGIGVLEQVLADL